MAAATGDTTFTTKVTTLVAELAKCQMALGKDGYLAAFPVTALDWLEGKGSSVYGIVVPYYTIQKIMSGLLDAHHYLGIQQALEVASMMGGFVQARLAGLSATTLENTFRTRDRVGFVCTWLEGRPILRSMGRTTHPRGVFPISSEGRAQGTEHSRSAPAG